MSTPELVQLITVPAGLFFLLLLVIAAFLPWFGVSVPGVSGPSFSGVGFREAGIFMVGCLLVGTAVGLTYLWKDLLPRVAVTAAGLGVFAFFFMLSAILRYGGAARAGVWVGFVASLFAAGAFVTLAVFRPLELAAPASQSLSPFLKRYGALLLAGGVGAGLGIIYLVVTAIAGNPMLSVGPILD
ncbi:MAG: hypothetical protein L0Z62_17530 [Gemmataceae bacterium]|nr:hypothetical protein [Gemmataceae bacterium]